MHCSPCPTPTSPRGCVIFSAFWGGPKLQNYINVNVILPSESRFLTRRLKHSKNVIPVTKCPEKSYPIVDLVLSLFSRRSTKRFHYLDFSRVKNASKVMEIANSELLHGPFIYLEHAFRRVRKIMQNYAKMHKNHRKMSTKKYGSRSRNGKKYTPSLDVPERVKMRSLLLFTVLHCSGKVCRHHVN